MTIIKCLLLVTFTVTTHAAFLPYEEDSEGVVYLASPVVREKRTAYPGRTMMFHGYFGHPYQVPQQTYSSNNGRSYDPQGAMTAFAAGDSVAAGSSYYGNNCSNCKKPANGNGKKNGNGNGYPLNGNGHDHGNGHPLNGNANGYPQPDVPAVKPQNGEKPVEEQDTGYPTNGNGADNEVPQEAGNGEEGYLGDQPAAEETPKGETLPPAAPTEAAAPQGPKKIPDESDEEDEEPSFFSHKGRGRGPYYNSYFPMVFGAFPGYGGGRGGNREEGGAYNPGVATAIANSFSTGRGAVATSHATAYGGPQFVPSGYRKNGSRARPH